MSRFLLLPAVAVLMVAGLSLAQTPDLGGTQTGEIPAGANQLGTEVSSTYCTNQDSLFADKLSQTYLLLGGVSTLLLVPALLPLGFRYRLWWLTRPVMRWVILATVGWSLVLISGVLIPQLVVDGRLSRDVLRIVYGALQPDYIDCINVPVASKGVLWGAFGDKARVMVAQDGPMWFGAGVVTAVGSASYWALYFLFRSRSGSPSWLVKDN